MLRGKKMGNFKILSFNVEHRKHTASITISLMFIRSSHIWFSYIHIHIIHYHRVYDELTIDHLSMLLDSSVDRALHWYPKVMGSSPVQGLNFFRLLFQLLKLKAAARITISLKRFNIHQDIIKVCNAFLPVPLICCGCILQTKGKVISLI